MRLVPVYNKVIVEVLPEKTNSQTAGGLYLPGKSTPYYRGKVIGVGKGHYQNGIRIPVDAEVGQVILFLKNSGMGVEFDDSGKVTKILIGDGDIYAVETED